MNQSKKNIYRFILVGVFLFCFSEAKAATISVVDSYGNPSCQQVDVQTAINNAVDGDVIAISELPACTWTTGITISKSVVIQGDGVGKTIIIDDTATGWGNSLFWFENNNEKYFRVSGFTFQGTARGTSDFWGAIGIIGNWKNWRIDNCKFDNLYSTAIAIKGLTNGLIDHCTILHDQGHSCVAGILYTGDGTIAWTRPLSLGTINAVYLEDNKFIYDKQCDSIIAGVAGARYVFRHNESLNTGIDAHGADSNPNGSTYSWEVYDNTFTTNLSALYSTIYMRGGTGVAFNNKMIGNWNAKNMHLEYFRSCFNEDECTAFSVPTKPSWGHCNVNANWFSRCDGNSSLDGNTPGKMGWPCFQQPGTSNIGSDPIYEWNNTFNGNDLDWGVDTKCSAPSEADHIQENRDFFNDTPRPGYTPYIYPHPIRTDCANYPMTCDQTQSNCTLGDVDCSGQVNSQDIQIAINIFLGTAEFNTKADLVADGKINIQDIQRIINIVLGI